MDFQRGIGCRLSARTFEYIFNLQRTGGLPAGAPILGFDPFAPDTEGISEEFCVGSDMLERPPSVVHDDKKATRINIPVNFCRYFIPDYSKYFDYS